MPADHSQPSTLSITLHLADDRRVVRLAGALTIDQTPALRDMLTELTATGIQQQVVLDLSGLTYLGAAGLGVILDTHRRMLRRGGSLALAAPTPAVWEVIRMTRVDGLIPVWACVEDALACEEPLPCAG
jgi:anti-anti-sigma factor